VLRDIENLHREVARLSRPRSAVITPTPGGSPVEVRVGDEVEIAYEGELRRVRILAITDWGLRCRDLDKQSMRSFTFMKIGAAEMPHETDEAASG
jgi:hypothetical protein